MKKPSIEEVRLDALKRGLPEVEADKFFYYYDSKNWFVGKSPMKNWHSALAHWTLVWNERHQTISKGKASVYELIKIMEANQRIADELKRKHCTFVAGGNQWSSLEVYRQWQVIKAHISDLNDEIASMKT